MIRALRIRARAGVSGRDEGWVSIWLLGVIPLVFLAVGLVVDGGRAIAAHSAAVGIADQAARAAVDTLDQAGYRRSGDLRAVAPGAATAAGCGWVAAAHPGATCAAQVGVGGTVTVTTTVRYTPAILSAIGVGPLAATGSSQARPAIGDTTEIGAP